MAPRPPNRERLRHWDSRGCIHGFLPIHSGGAIVVLAVRPMNVCELSDFRCVTHIMVHTEERGRVRATTSYPQSSAALHFLSKNRCIIRLWLPSLFLRHTWEHPLDGPFGGGSSLRLYACY